MIKFYGLINICGSLEKISIEELKENLYTFKNDSAIRSIVIIDNLGNIYKKIK